MDEAERKEREDHRARQIQAYEMYKRFGRSPEGEQILKDLEALCFVHRTTLAQSAVTGAGDPLITAYHEGRRSVYLWFQSRMRIANSPELLKMALEQTLEEED